MQARDYQLSDDTPRTASASDPALEPVPEAQRLALLLDDFAADAELRAPAYLRETVVPEGGE